MRAAGVEQRETRLAVLGPAVVAHDIVRLLTSPDSDAPDRSRSRRIPPGSPRSGRARRPGPLVRERRRTAKPRTGSVTMPPITAETERRRQRGVCCRGYITSSFGGSSSGVRLTVRARVSGSTAGGGVRTGFVVRIQRKPNTIAITAPTTATIVLTTRPVRMRATPGEADRPEARRRQVRLVLVAQVFGFNPCAACAVNDVSAAATRGESHSLPGRPSIVRRYPVLGPAPVDQLLDSVAHHDLLGHSRPLRAGSSRSRRSRSCRRRTAASALVEMVERPLREARRVAHRVDIRADVRRPPRSRARSRARRRRRPPSRG